mmetsp:Transcript_135339/g.239434  ORF Transcript_135339/g.239434 Transcript_135339/m.239434 type:complete len:303 (+) Transcript_135339:120-1028(+)
MSTSTRLVSKPNKAATLPSPAQQRALAAVASALPRGAKTSQVKSRASGRDGAAGSKPCITECWVGGSECNKGQLNKKSVAVTGEPTSTLASIGAAPRRRPPQKQAPTLATIRESEELAAEWATSSCAMVSQADAEESDIDQDIGAPPAQSRTSSKHVPDPVCGSNVLSALQRYGGGHAIAASPSLGPALFLDPSPGGTALKTSLGFALSKQSPSTIGRDYAQVSQVSQESMEVVDEASSAQPTKSTLMEVFGSTNWSSRAKSGMTSSSSSESSSSANSSPDGSLSPRERKGLPLSQPISVAC